LATIRKVNGKKGTTYRTEVRRTGYPYQAKNFKRRGDAERWARKVEREMDAGTWRNVKGAEKLVLAKALDRYFETVSPKKRPSTMKREGQIIPHIKRIIGKYTLTQITEDKVAEYRDVRLKQVSPGTVVRELRLLSHVFSTAKREWGVGDINNPVANISKPREPEGRCPALTGAQVAKLLVECKKASTEYLYPFVLLALHTGCRSGELRGLKWSQVDLDGGYIHLSGKDTKNHRRRSVRLTQPAVTTLKEMANNSKMFDVYGMPTGLIFPAKGKPDQPRDMHMAFNRAVKRAGLDNLPGEGKLRTHDLRHIHSTHLIIFGADLETTRKSLGHRDITDVPTINFG